MTSLNGTLHIIKIDLKQFFPARELGISTLLIHFLYKAKGSYQTVKGVGSMILLNLGVSLIAPK